MAPSPISSPSSAASTSRHLIGLLRNAGGSQSHPKSASRLRQPSATATSNFRFLPVASPHSSSSSTSLNLSFLDRRPFASSARTLATSAVVSNDGDSVTPQKSTEELKAWFRERFPGIDLPDNVILQTATHESWNHGLTTDGHNRRLGFIGRRALQMFLSIFLHSNMHVSKNVSDLLGSQDVLPDLLQTSRLGDKVGRTLRLEEIMRWTPAVRGGQQGPVQTGLFKIRGATVEALVGAIYHQYGAAVARSFFQAHILPNLETLSTGIRSELRSAIMAEANAGVAVLAAMAERASGGEAASLNNVSPSALPRVVTESSAMDIPEERPASALGAAPSPARRSNERPLAAGSASLHSEAGGVATAEGRA